MTRTYITRLAAAAAMTLVAGGVIVSLTPGSTFAALPHPAAKATASPFRVVPSPQLGVTAQLIASTAISTTDAWAVGRDFVGAGQTLAEHWNGTAWTVVATPNPGGNATLTAVSKISSGDVWAVGDSNGCCNGGAGSLFSEHWNGTGWRLVSTPVPSSVTLPQFTGIVAISSNNVYAVGNFEDIRGCQSPLIEHWNGTAWSIIHGAGSCGASPAGVSASSASDVWVVGTVYDQQYTPFIEHFDGHTWRVVPTPALSGLAAVTDLSPTNAWAVGQDVSHWDGTAWTVVTSSPRIYLTAITSLSTSDLWAVGFDSYAYRTVAEHFDGAAWSVVPTPSPGTAAFLLGVSSAGGHVYAVGWTRPAGGREATLILENDRG